MYEMIYLPTRVMPSTYFLEFEFGGSKMEPWVFLQYLLLNRHVLYRITLLSNEESPCEHCASI